MILRIAGVAAASLLVANCAGQVERQGAKQDRFNKKYGVSSSPRVVREGDPVPKGGGRAMLGKPYTVAGKRYTPIDNPGYVATGVASWYGPNFHGRMTANGEVFDKQSIAAAHPTLPLPSYVRVTNMDNGLSLVVRVNDRGPYHGRRVIDVSRRAAELLEFRQMGTARVKVDFIRRASVNGSDDMILASTLSEGAPAQLDRGSSRVMVASASPSRFEPAREPVREPARVEPLYASAPSHHAPPQMTTRPAEDVVASTDGDNNRSSDPSREGNFDRAGLNQLAGVSRQQPAGQEAEATSEEFASVFPATAPLPPIRPIVVASGH